MNSSVSSKNSSTKGADYSFPRLPIKGHEAKSCGRLHVGHARSPTAARAYSGGRLASLHLPFLIHKKTEHHHAVSFF